LLAFLALGVSKAQASPTDMHPVGITFGQTARVNILNTGDRAIIIIGGKFIDSDGNVIAEFRGTIDPGKTMSFDLDGDTVPRTENRIEIHVVIEGPVPHLAVISLEVFDHPDGRTTVFAPCDNVVARKPPVGITSGQTARVNILNTGDRGFIIDGGKFIDADGNVIAEFRGTIDPGKTMSFDLNGDTLGRRVEIHVAIEGPVPHLKEVVMSMEVFNNADGKTTVFVPADILVNPSL
jgi:hypothetical protein